MTQYDQLRRDIDSALARLDRYTIALQNIAQGHYSAGRSEPLPVEDYAKLTLYPFDDELVRASER